MASTQLRQTRELPRVRAAPRGFSLIELMIVVAIIGLLAGIAYPAYTSSVIKGKRAEGRQALLDLLQQQERYFTQTGSYMTFSAGATGANGTVNPSTSGQSIPFKTTSGSSASASAYRLSAGQCGSLARNECVLLTAVPNFTDSDYGSLTLSSAGAKSCSTGNAKCWAR